MSIEEIRIREIAREEIDRARRERDVLSPAPVGEDEDARREGREAAERICAKVYGDPNRRAPTPPAKDTEGWAKTGEELHAEHRRIIADLEARLAEAERINIAAEQRLKDEIVVERRASHRSELAASAAEHALADATKRIEALEAGLRNPTPAMRRKAADILTVVGLDGAWDIGHDLLVRVGAVLLSPASEGKT